MSEDEKLKEIQSRLEKLKVSVTNLKIAFTMLLVIVIALVVAIHKSRQDIGEPVRIVIGSMIVLILITIIVSRYGPKSKSWQDKDKPN